MSLQVNLSSKDIGQAYQDVVNANGIDWAIFTYEKASNDLKVQGTGNGGLEELEEEFSDGRYAHNLLVFVRSPLMAHAFSIQYAFVRVKDPNVSNNISPCLILLKDANMRQSQLPKFVQINWCGDGVPETKKGLFHTHSNAVANYLRGTHVVISARNEVKYSCTTSFSYQAYAFVILCSLTLLQR